MEEKVVDNEKLKTYIDITKITIVICWISLFAFWAIKLFGGNFFEIVVENDNFVKFSEMVETTWLKYLVSFITIAVAKYLTFGAICQKFYFKGKQLAFVLFGIVSIWAVANFLPLGFLNFSSWYGYLIFILAGILYQKGWRKSFGVLAIVFETAFTLLSCLIRDVTFVVLSNYLIILVLSLDMYIMATLYYLYLNLLKLKKES